jgi:hypothetical protein
MAQPKSINLLKLFNHSEIIKPLWVLTQKTKLSELSSIDSSVYDHLEKFFKRFKRVLPIKDTASKKGSVTKITRTKNAYYLKQPLIFLLLVKMYKINPSLFSSVHHDFVHTIKHEKIPEFIGLYNQHARDVLALIDISQTVDLLGSMWNHLAPFIDYYHNIFISIENHMQIEQNVTMLYQYTSDNIQINLFCEEKTKEYYAVISDILEIVMWFQNVFSVNSSKFLKISFYYLNNLKTFPHTYSVFTSNDMNSGSNLPGEWIQLWRIEEWRKVLMHELIHYYGFDLEDHSNQLGKQIYSLFQWNLTPDYPNEAITEVRAVLLHTLYNTLKIYRKYKLKDHLTIKTAFNQLLYYELCFSIVQTCKLLRYLKYDSLHDFISKLKDPKRFLNQSVSVFSYIILKTLLLFDLIFHSYIFTDSVSKLVNYYANVWLHINDHPINQFIQSVYPVLQRWYIDHADDYSLFLSTNRMTVLELV